jgi:hypothetical protein
VAGRADRRLQVLRVAVPAGHDPGVQVVGLQALLTSQPLGEQVVQQPAHPSAARQDLADHRSGQPSTQHAGRIIDPGRRPLAPATAAASHSGGS